MPSSSLRIEPGLPKGAPSSGFEPAPPAPVAPTTPSRFAQALRSLGREIDGGEKQMAAASELRDYDTRTLIALQAGIYRYTEAVDLASKIVDRATSAVHTVLQSGAR